MSFWASSQSFALDRLGQLFHSGPMRVSFYDDCKETRTMFPKFVIFSIESFDAMLGRVQVRTC